MSERLFTGVAVEKLLPTMWVPVHYGSISVAHAGAVELSLFFPSQACPALARTQARTPAPPQRATRTQRTHQNRHIHTPAHTERGALWDSETPL
jgi:hypothetical protein